MADQKTLPNPDEDLAHFSKLFQEEAQKATVPEMRDHWTKRAQHFASKAKPPKLRLVK
jgi:hypothetical protein